MGAGLDGVSGFVVAGGEEEGEGALGASDVAALLTHASFPSSSRTRNQSPFASRIPKVIPRFAVPMTL